MRRADAALLWNTIAQPGGGAGPVSTLGGAAIVAGATTHIRMKLDSGGGQHPVADDDTRDVAAFLRGWAADIDGQAESLNSALENEPDRAVDEALQRLERALQPGALNQREIATGCVVPTEDIEPLIADLMRLLAMVNALGFGTMQGNANAMLGKVYEDHPSLRCRR